MGPHLGRIVLKRSLFPIEKSALHDFIYGCTASKSYEQVPPGGEAIGAGSSGPSVDLSTALTGEALQPILSQEGFLDKVRS